MNKGQFTTLRTGDIVRHQLGADAYVVTDNFGDRVTATRSVDITNPAEWILVAKSPAIVSIARTRAAVEYIANETGLDPGSAEELLQTVIGMCQFKAS
jgi:hypothetical protein